MSNPERPETGHWMSPPGFPALLWKTAAERPGPRAESPALPAAGALRLDPHGRRIYLDGQVVTLTAKEYLLTELLFRSASGALTFQVTPGSWTPTSSACAASWARE